MTIWKAGMLAVCVRGGGNDFDAQSGLFAGPYGEVLVERKVYRVIYVLTASDGTGRVGLYVDETHDAGWFADRFRPLIDEPDNAELIERIKACKPKRTPVLADSCPDGGTKVIETSTAAFEASPRGAGRVGGGISHAASDTPTQPLKDALDRGAQSDRFVGHLAIAHNETEGQDHG